MGRWGSVGGCSGQGAHPHQCGPCTPMSPLFPQLSWAHQAPMGQPEGVCGGDAGESRSPFPSAPAPNPFLLPSLGAKWHSGGALLSLLAVPMAIPLPWYPLRLPWQRDAASAACSAASIPPSGSRVCGHTHAHMQTRVHTRAHAHQSKAEGQPGACLSFPQFRSLKGRNLAGEPGWGWSPGTPWPSGPPSSAPCPPVPVPEQGWQRPRQLVPHRDPTAS